MKKMEDILLTAIKLLHSKENSSFDALFSIYEQILASNEEKCEYIYLLL
jgi:hypothetical protein